MKEDILKPRFVNMPQKTEKINPVSFNDVDGYFDASPVRILYGGMQASIKEREENLVYETVINMGVDIDKEKLLHALAYDRMQYYEGYNAGMKAISNVSWISVEERLPGDPLDGVGDVVELLIDKGDVKEVLPGYYDHDEKDWVIYFGDPSGLYLSKYFSWWRVSKWRPLPEPPK